MKKLCLILIALLASVSFAQSGLKGGTDGLHEQNAYTLGQWNVTAGLGITGAIDSWASMRGGQYYVDGKLRGLPETSPTFDFYLFAGVGLLPFLDVGFALPFYYDHANDETAGTLDLWASGVGDLELWAKLSAPFISNESVFQMALLLGMTVPTGEAGFGMRVRHAYYYDLVQTQAWTADQIILSASLIGTLDFSKIGVPIRWNANIGYVATIDYGANTVVWGTGLNYLASSLFDIFLEFHAETRVEKTNISRSAYDLDPMVLTPGVRFHFGYNIDFALGLDVGMKNFTNPTFKTDKEIDQARKVGASYVRKMDSGKRIRTYMQNEPHYGFSALLSWRLGASAPKDADEDGVEDDKDLCPHTPKGAPVDENGCPLDSDNDSIPDYKDQCENTPKGAIVDSTGCPLDSDKDGIPDGLDKCEASPKGAIVDSTGCPLDSDKDGVFDGIDKCENTPEGLTVDSEGCPLDSDKDGVPDHLDKCPNTPEGLTVDSTGCAADSDKDGVPDGVDQCENTPKGVQVDSVGCPLDSDKDGVPDYLDKCPNTIPGVKIDKNGCPVNKKQDLNRLRQGINFESGSAKLTKNSYGTLDDIAKLLIEIPEANLEVQGHTDNTGSAEKNKQLSQERAQSVVDYLVHKGVDQDRLRAIGFGQEKPIESNKTKAGRTKNRRVELVPFQK